MEVTLEQVLNFALGFMVGFTIVYFVASLSMRRH